MWGNATTWLHTQLGQHLVVNSIDPRELGWRLPILLSASRLWQRERQDALARFKSDQRTH